jgi:uncharacterized protein (UPF0212 family)
MAIERRPLTDNEIRRKYGIDRGDARFPAAKALDDGRRDYTLSDLPMATCPHCGEEFQWDDYYDVRAGSERECPRCERTIHVLSVDTTITARLGTEPEE